MRFIDILPTIIIVESLAAAGILAAAGRWGSALYWAAAGLLNIAVVFLVGRWG